MREVTQFGYLQADSECSRGISNYRKWIISYAGSAFFCHGMLEFWLTNLIIVHIVKFVSLN